MTADLRPSLLPESSFYHVSLWHFCKISDGADYIGYAQELTFAAGSAVGDALCLSVAILDDHILESDERYIDTIYGLNLGTLTVILTLCAQIYCGFHCGSSQCSDSRWETDCRCDHC